MRAKFIDLHRGEPEVGSTALQRSLGQLHGAMNPIWRAQQCWLAERLGDPVASRRFTRSDVEKCAKHAPLGPDGDRGFSDD
jgi:hypothetical protein